MTTEIEIDQIANSFRKKPKRNSNQETQTDETMEILEIIEHDMNKFRIENLRLQQQIKQLQDTIALYSNNVTNTSSKFMLPSEFKIKYECMVKESLPSAFGSLFDQPKLLVQVVQQSCLFLEQLIRECINNKTKQIAELLGISQQGLFGVLQKLYQDNYASVLCYDDNTLIKMKSTLKITIKNIDEWLEEENEDLNEWIKQYWLILAYVILSDQEINIGFSEVSYEIVPFQKNEYYCIDGFGKDDVKCLIILPPIMRKNLAFNGIKPAVLILSTRIDLSIFKDDQNIDIIQEMKSYNSPKQIVIPNNVQQLDSKRSSQISGRENSNTFYSQRSDKMESIDEYRIKPHQKNPQAKSVKETLRQLNQYNNIQSYKEFNKLIKPHQNQDIKKSLQQSIMSGKIYTGNSWSKIVSNYKKNKENNQQLNTSQNCSFRFTIQQFIKKIQLDGCIQSKHKQNDSKLIQQTSMQISKQESLERNRIYSQLQQMNDNLFNQKIKKQNLSCLDNTQAKISPVIINNKDEIEFEENNKSLQTMLQTPEYDTTQKNTKRKYK